MLALVDYLAESASLWMMILMKHTANSTKAELGMKSMKGCSSSANKACFDASAGAAGVGGDEDGSGLGDSASGGNACVSGNGASSGAGEAGAGGSSDNGRQAIWPVGLSAGGLWDGLTAPWSRLG